MISTKKSERLDAIFMILATAVLLVVAASFAVEDAQAVISNKWLDEDNKFEAKKNHDAGSAFSGEAKSKSDGGGDKSPTTDDGEPIAPLVFVDPNGFPYDFSELPSPDEVCAECQCCNTGPSDGGTSPP
jgi:hypothetical protein